jgi:hypothetical protein
MRYSTLPVLAVLAYTSTSIASPQIGSVVDSLTSVIGGGFDTATSDIAGGFSTATSVVGGAISTGISYAGGACKCWGASCFELSYACFQEQLLIAP